MKCNTCSSKAAPKRKSCRRCLNLALERRRVARETRLADGVCVNCGDEIEKDFLTKCNKCLEVDTTYQKRKQKENAEKGLCVCGKDKHLNTNRCITCIEAKERSVLWKSFK